MTYQLTGNYLLFEIKRTDIIDISPDDEITVEGFEGIKYIWTNQDGEFLESNPDDDIYLQVERVGNNKFKATGILLK